MIRTGFEHAACIVLIALAMACSSGSASDTRLGGGVGGTSSGGSSASPSASGSSQSSAGSADAGGSTPSGGTRSGDAAGAAGFAISSGGNANGTAGGGSSGSPSTNAAGASGAAGMSGAPGVDLNWGTPVIGVAPYSGSTVTGTVKVDPSTTTGKIGVGYAGFSFEKTHITNGSLSGSNKPLISLMSLLPGTVIRLGANDVDKCTWVANAPVQRTLGSFSHSIGTADVDGLADFVKASGARVIYGLNFKLNQPQAADAAEAAYAMSKLGDFIDGFELGNEINGVGTWPQLKSKWELIQSTIAKAAPTAKFIGPAGEGGWQTSFTTPFSHDEASKIVALTQHYYAGTADKAGLTNADYLAKLLVPDPFSLTDILGFFNMLQVMSANVAADKIPGGFRIGECNTFSHHGQDGVSNTLVSALWALDYMFIAAQNGAAGVNFHGGEKGMDGNTIFYYAPFDESNGVLQGVNPIFYGILMFTLAGNGDVVATTANSSAAHFTAYALSRSDGALSVIIDNKDPTTGVTASVDVGKPVASASAIYLQGPAPASLTARSGVTLAGSGITAAGEWARDAPSALSSAGNTFTITMPPASAALVRVR